MQRTEERWLVEMPRVLAAADLGRYAAQSLVEKWAEVLVAQQLAC
jgi:hypothetical protein